MRENEPRGIDVRPVRTARDRRAFLDVPHRIFAGDPAWVAPLFRDERRKLMPGRHPFFAQGEAEFWIAWRGDEPVGRISAQTNARAVPRDAPRTVFFGMLDAIDDGGVFAALIGAAAAWARARGGTALEGPYNLSLKEEFGVLVDGFETPPLVMMAHSRPYYLARLVEQGFAKVKDFYHVGVHIEGTDWPRMRALLGRLRVADACQIRHSSARHLRRDFHRGTRVYNDAWRQQWGFLPVTDAEVEFLADRLRFIFDPKMLMLAEHAGETIALCCCIPDYNEATRGLGGRLLPFGWLKFMARARRIKGIRLILFGVAERYQKTPLGTSLNFLLLERMVAYLFHLRATTRPSYARLEIAWVMEDNHEILKLTKLFGAEHRKTYRVLSLPLA